MRKSFLLALVLVSWVARAQQTLVPDNVYFAGMHLKVTRAAREELQQHVDFLLKNPNYVQMKVERADLYFPIVQRVFQEEGLPDDFKYLALQESGLVSDAVSTSNAVGFWQFKKEAASDMGLLINNNVDERKHIVASSRGAARYLLKHNAYFKNWVTTLLSYNLGFTGAKNVTKTSEINVTEAEIDKGTHIYIMKFLAHKIAFENLVGKNSTPKQNLRELPVTAGQSLLDVAKAANIDVAELERYNKWLNSTTVPADKAYVMLLPISGSDQTAISGISPLPAPATLVGPVAPTPLSYSKLNGLKVVQARAGDTKERLALQSGLNIKQFLKFNDLYGFDAIEEGQFYYVEAKNTRAEAEFHVAAPGENLHKISQKYGVKVKALRSHNRMGKGEVVVAGRVIWLKNTRPRNTPVEYHNVPEPVSATPAPVAPKPAEAEVVPTLVVEVPGAPAVEPAVNTETPVSQVNEKPLATEAVKPSETAVPAPAKNLLTKPESVKTEAPKTTETTAVKSEVIEPAPAAVTSIHTVARGESLYSIAKKYATTIENLKLWNSLNSAALIVGQKLKVQGPEIPVSSESVPTSVVNEKATASVTTPVPAAVTETAAPVAAPSSAVETHTVAKGESLYVIARKYGCSVVELLDWNGKTDPALKIGEVLKVKKPAVTE